MSQVAIEKVHGDQANSGSLLEKTANLAERIRDRAFQIFQRRAGENGSELDDWLEAERELIMAPESNLIEKDGKFELKMSIPGFEAKELEVTALPDAVVVHAESTRRNNKTEGDIHYREIGERSLFRRIDLPTPINVDQVSATLDNGVLRLTAAKAKAA